MKQTDEERRALAAHFQAGRFELVEERCRALLQADPDSAELTNMLGAALHARGRVFEAVACYRRATQVAAGQPEPYYNLANGLHDLGAHEEAIASYDRALQLLPDYPEALNNRGNALRAIGSLTDALASYERAIDSRPQFADAHANRGTALHELGRTTDAVASYTTALRLAPGSAAFLNNRGIAYLDLGRADLALADFERAIETRPDFADAHNSRGTALRGLGRVSDALSSFDAAARLDPGSATALSNRAASLRDLGRMSEAVASCAAALQLQPDYAPAHSNLLFFMNQSEDYDHAERLAAAKRFDDVVTAQAAPRSFEYACSRAPERLRVGVVSGDLNNHPVGFILESVLPALAQHQVELFAYPTSRKTDELTAKLRPAFSGWTGITGMADEAAAKRIRDDGIHVLLDLAGHTAGNRLPVFAWRPAPLQISWLGYFATTGLHHMDFILADPCVAPETDEGRYVEQVWRLPKAFFCYAPPDGAPDVSPLPARHTGAVTFGCFNNPAKLHDGVVALWAKLIGRIPKSRLLLKASQYAVTAECERIVRQFQAAGIPSSRLQLEGRTPRPEYLRAYHRVDMALDPFPYPGGATTLEALWMGVPTLTMRGRDFLSRQGETIASNAGLPGWIADDEDYLTKAAALATDLDGLARLRAELRARVGRSPLFDASGFADDLQDALWRMWREKGAPRAAP